MFWSNEPQGRMIRPSWPVTPPTRRSTRTRNPVVGNRLIDSESNVAEFAYIQDLTAHPDKTTRRILRYLTANSAHEYNYRNEIYDFLYRRDRALSQRVQELVNNVNTQTSRPTWPTLSREMFRHPIPTDIHRSNVMREISCLCQATREPEIVIVRRRSSPRRRTSGPSRATPSRSAGRSASGTARRR